MKYLLLIAIFVFAYKDFLNAQNQGPPRTAAVCYGRICPQGTVWCLKWINTTANDRELDVNTACLSQNMTVLASTNREILNRFYPILSFEGVVITGARQIPLFPGFRPFPPNVINRFQNGNSAGNNTS